MERSLLTNDHLLTKCEAKTTMIKTSIRLQELRRKIYIKAKADKADRFWGLYVHVCKESTLLEAYQMVKRNNGAPGIDGMTFDDIEKSGVEVFVLAIRHELINGSYQPSRNRIKEIPKANGKMRKLGIPKLLSYYLFYSLR